MLTVNARARGNDPMRLPRYRECTQRDVFVALMERGRTIAPRPLPVFPGARGFSFLKFISLITLCPLIYEI